MPLTINNPTMMFIVFQLSHCFVVVLLPSGRLCTVSLLLAIFSLLSLSSLYLDLLHLSRGLSETSSLAPRGSGTVSVHSTFP